MGGIFKIRSIFILHFSRIFSISIPLTLVLTTIQRALLASPRLPRYMQRFSCTCMNSFDPRRNWLFLPLRAAGRLMRFHVASTCTYPIDVIKPGMSEASMSFESAFQKSLRLRRSVLAPRKGCAPLTRHHVITSSWTSVAGLHSSIA